jgi:hypothetical protein
MPFPGIPVITSEATLRIRFWIWRAPRYVGAALVGRCLVGQALAGRFLVRPALAVQT